MSSSELLPLFPSATHPAIPIAARILSTLRTLTAPGKGNDLKAPERAALVGVAAFLGCEKIQSKDLLESSAQKASSVSPAHFKSALAKSRRVLATAESLSSPTRRTKYTSTPSSPTPLPVPVPEPVHTPQTPSRRHDGIDRTTLLRSGPGARRTPGGHGHEPSTGSPLKQSLTPRVREDENEGDNLQLTPTKRNKHPRPGTRTQGVNLEKATVSVADDDDDNLTQGSRVRKENTSAFFALLGQAGTSAAGSRMAMEKLRADAALEEEMAYLESRNLASARARAGRTRRARRKTREKRDWTFAERVWGEAARAGIEEYMNEILERLPAYLESNGLPALSHTSRKDASNRSFLSILSPATG